jgi:pimeloyl-ACP methyl ester carboxylesterase
MTLSKATLTVAGQPVDYWAGGSGAPVLALHSAAGFRASAGLEALAQARRVFAPVMPGFDGTAKNERIRSMADLADLTSEFIDAAKTGPCDVVGHSFGGWLAAWLAVRHPDKIRQMVLVGAAGFRPEGVGGLVGTPDELRPLLFAHPEKLPPEQKPPAVLMQNRQMLDRYGALAATDAGLVARLGEIKALTLILHGLKDGVIPLASPRLLKEKIAGAHLVYVYDAAHVIDIDQPERYAALIGDFLARGDAFIVNSGARAV